MRSTLLLPWATLLMPLAMEPVWTSIGVNYSIYKPTAEQILERYLLKFSKGGKATADKLHEHDLGLLDPVHEDGEGYVVQAGSN